MQIDCLKLRSNSINVHNVANAKIHSIVDGLKKDKIFNDIKFDKQNQNISVTFNPVTFNGNDDNSRIFKHTDFIKVIKNINEILSKSFKEIKSDIGLEDVYNWKISRVDLAAYYELNHLFQNYVSIFNQFKAKQNLIRKGFNDDTICFVSKRNNGQPSNNLQIKFENKNKQLYISKKIKDKRVENLLQVEVKLNSSSIKTKLDSIVYLKDLMTPDSNIFLTGKFKVLLKDYIFYNKEIDSDILSNSLNDLKMLEKINKQNSLIYLLALMHTPDNFDYKTLGALGEGKMKKETINKQLEDFKNLRRMYKKNSNLLDSNDLYLELYSKVFKEDGGI